MSELQTNHVILSDNEAKESRAQALTQLIKVLQTLGSEEEFSKFFADLCTPAELKSMADRWRVACLLNQRLSYRSIYEKTGVSTATITRVARSLTYGAGGYNMALERTRGELL